MADRKPIATAGELAALLSAELQGPADVAVYGISGIDDAGEGDLTFIRSDRYATRWGASGASAAIVTRGLHVVPGTERAVLFVDDADRAMVMLLEAAAERAPKPSRSVGVHPAAVVDPSAVVHGSASVGPGAVVEGGAEIGAGVTIGPNSVVGEGVRVGEGTTLHAGVTLGFGTTVGGGCEFHPGVVIGADGFGYLPGPRGPIKVPHLGGVTIGNGVEIGANSCVDRGKFADTTIGDATKIDNLVQIGHGCQIGRGVVICGCSSVAGSVHIGDGALLGGSVSVRDNVVISAGAQIGGTSVVFNDVPAGEKWFGNPARPGAAATRVFASLQKLPKLREDVLTLKAEIKALKGRQG